MYPCMFCLLKAKMTVNVLVQNVSIYFNAEIDFYCIRFIFTYRLLKFITS